MFRKKRIALLVFLGGTAYLGVVHGVWAAAACLGLLALMLGCIGLSHYFRAHRGREKLEALRGQYGYPALLKIAQARATNPEDFTFVVLGDTRNKKKTTAMVYERAAAEDPAFICHTGDIIRHGTADEFLENHIALLKRCTPGIPMFCVPGNHERGARRDFAGFKALYGDDTFSFEIGPCRFVGFNNSTRGRVTKADLKFLDTELGRAGASHKFVFLHIPPVFFEETFAHDKRRRGFRKNAEEMHAMFRRQGVNEVFMAHIHGYATFVRDGVRYTLTAGGGAPLSRRLAPEFRAYNYVAVRVTPGGLQRTVNLCVDGTWQRREE